MLTDKPNNNTIQLRERQVMTDHNNHHSTTRMQVDEGEERKGEVDRGRWKAVVVLSPVEGLIVFSSQLSVDRHNGLLSR